MEPWTTPEDIKARWIGNKPLPTDAKLSTFIADVERQIRRKYRSIELRIISEYEDIDVELIKQNVSNWVIEFLQTEGKPFQQESQSYSGAASRSISMNSKARYTLTLTDDDLLVFAPIEDGKAFALNIIPDAYVPFSARHHYGRIGDNNPYLIYGFGEYCD